MKKIITKLNNFIKVKVNNKYFVNSNALKDDYIETTVIAFNTLEAAKELSSEVFEVEINTDTILDIYRLEHYTNLTQNSYGYRIYRDIKTNIYDIQHAKISDLDAIYELIRKGNKKRILQKWFKKLLLNNNFGGSYFKNGDNKRILITNPNVFTDINII